MKNIVVVVNVKIKSEFKDEVYSELVKLYKATHRYDDGVVQYELHKELDVEDSFTFIETWENEALLLAHEKKDYFLNFLSSIDNKLESLWVQKLEKLTI